MTSFIEHLPITLAGMKSLAKRWKRSGAGSYMAMLDRAAALAGYSNWRHAQHELSQARAPVANSAAAHPSGYLVTISGVARKDSGDWVRIAAECEFHRPLGQLVTPDLFRVARALYGYEVSSESELAAKYSFEFGADAAKPKLWKALASLRLIARTGLRRATPSQASRLSLKLREAPCHDHVSHWEHPSKVLIELREPYEPALNREALAREADRVGYSHAIARTGTGIYNAKTAPIFMAEAGNEDLVVELAKLSSAQPDVRILKPQVTVIDNVPRPRPLPPLGPNAVRMRPLFGRPGSRPAGKMPLAGHRTIAGHLHWISQFKGSKRLASVVGDVRCDLDDWVQREYPTEKEMSQAEFSNLYYGRDTLKSSRPTAAEVQEGNTRCAEMVDLLLRSYPESRPRDQMVEKVQRIPKLLETCAKPAVMTAF